MPQVLPPCDQRHTQLLATNTALTLYDRLMQAER